MNIGHAITTRNPSVTSLVERQFEEFHLDRDSAPYEQFDAQMTAQLQELELRFHDFWTPQAKKQEMLGRR